MASASINQSSQLIGIDILECPQCRTINKDTQVFPIKGLDVKCCICLENDVSNYFIACKHACVCNNCFKKLKDYYIINNHYLY